MNEDLTNKFLVGSTGEKITILNPPKEPMSYREALIFAAWIVSLADDDNAEFEDILCEISLM